MSNRAPRIRLFEDEAFIDGFAGGGGASTGIEMALGYSPDVAINHDREALAMHRANHPKTRHIRSNIKTVNFKRVMRGKPVGGAWFSPDCTYHSKARGGKPFRDRNKARRIRGLAWEMVRCAIQVRPRVLFMENVEEIEFWGPLDNRGVPIASKRGSSWRRFVARLTNLGYTCEWRRMRAMHYGAPTTRTRLVFIARCDGQPIVWPKQTHGRGCHFEYLTAAQCIDFTRPVPSIFLTKAQAKAWGKAHGVPAPKRPLVVATKRRIARGVFRYVLDTPEPFIIAVRHQDDSHVHSVHEPLTTIPASDREHALVAPVLAPFIAKHFGGRVGSSIIEPLHTVMANGAHHALVAPVLTKFHGPKRKGDARTLQVTEPIATLDTSNRFGLIAATLVNTRNGERTGQAPRVHNIRQPWGTITAHGSQGALVAAFLAKHNGGHEATGQALTRPADTIVCRENKALVTSHIVKLRGGLKDHKETSQDVRQPAPTLTAGGTHVAEVRTTLVRRDAISPEHVDRAVETAAFLVKFFGTGVARRVDAPADTLTTKERIGLVTVILLRVGDTEFLLVDIGMRMLSPRELFLCQGFPASYQINCTVKLPGKPRKRLTKKAQTRLVGNSVPPQLAAAVVAANMNVPASEAVA